MSNMNSILIYWTTLIVSLLFCRVYQKRNLRRWYNILFAAILIALPFSILAGLRYGVGTDYFGYRDYFIYIREHSINVSIQKLHIEFAFVLFTKLLCNLGFNNQWIFGIYQLIILTCFTYVILDNKDRLSVGLSFLLFYLLIFHYSMNILRQALAMGVIFLEVNLLLKNQVKKAIIAFIAALFIHSSACFGLSFIAIYCLQKKEMAKAYQPDVLQNPGVKMPKSSVISYFILFMIPLFSSFILRIVLKIPFLGKYAGYLFTDQSFSVFWIFKSVILFAPCLLFQFKKLTSDIRLSLLVQFTLVHILLLSVSSSAAWAGRVSFYTLSLFILLIPIMLNSIQINFGSKALMTIYYLGIFIYDYVRKIIILNYGQTLPYIPFWNYSIYG